MVLSGDKSPCGGSCEFNSKGREDFAENRQGSIIRRKEGAVSPRHGEDDIPCSGKTGRSEKDPGKDY